MRSRTRFAVATALLQCVGVCAWLPASAQAPDKADAAAARKEGNLSWYTSTPVALAQRLSIIGIPIRSDKVKDVPTTWSDLKHPKYKGLMVMPDPSFTAIQLVVVGMLSRTLGWDFYKALRANDTMIVQGHQQVFSTMQQGERIIGAEGADPRSFSDGQEVPNQKMVYPTEGVFIVSSPTAVIKGARNPNAAKLFAQFMISPVAQKMIADGGVHAARIDIAPPPGQPALSEMKFIPVDLDLIEERGRELKTRFADIFQ